ncbi:hypothetical protein KDA14_05230, partial [Candidatus Saccharibacteria bacterium]|nr:hypothetical protein [Candidatus Saccharibacteria bacterium]
MPKKRTASRNKKKKHMLSKPALVLAVLLIVCAGLAATTIPSVLPSSTVAQRFPGDPNPLVSGKAFFGASGDYIANHEAAAG